MENELLLQSKENFIKNGYCTISSEWIDLEFTDFLSNNFMCTDETNLQELFGAFRFDSPTIEMRCSSPNGNYNQIQNIKETIYDVETNKSDISQIWFMNNSWDKIDLFLKTNNSKKYIETKLNKIISYLYDFPNDSIISHPQIELSYYNKNCRFKPHTDGEYNRYICSIILYLNKDYNPDNGGLLILGNTLVTPEFGTIAIMDLTKHQIFHGVTEVTDGPGRYAILSFPELK